MSIVPQPSDQLYHGDETVSSIITHISEREKRESHPSLWGIYRNTHKSLQDLLTYKSNKHHQFSTKVKRKG